MHRKDVANWHAIKPELGRDGLVPVDDVIDDIAQHALDEARRREELVRLERERRAP